MRVSLSPRTISKEEVGFIEEDLAEQDFLDHVYFWNEEDSAEDWE